MIMIYYIHTIIMLQLGRCTLLITSKENGNAFKNQEFCMGVFRQMGTYNDKPLYKQDEGGCYLFYCKEDKSWGIGPQDPNKNCYNTIYMKNTCVSSDGDGPDQLNSPWQYWSRKENTWKQDDQSIQVHVLQG